MIGIILIWQKSSGMWESDFKSILSFKLIIMAGGSDVTEEIAPHSREKHAPFTGKQKKSFAFVLPYF